MGCFGFGMIELWEGVRSADRKKRKETQKVKRTPFVSSCSSKGQTYGIQIS